MATAELILRFSVTDSGSAQVDVSFDGAESGYLHFENPVNEKDRSDIRWYVETYGSMSLAKPDDHEARRIEQRLPEIGEALFRAVFLAGDGEANERYLDFRNARTSQRVITIVSSDSSILSVPWELLHDPRGVFLFREKPRISVRRRVAGAEKGRRLKKLKRKKHLNLLFVVSRPIDEGVSFIDPRSDPEAILDTLQTNAPGRITCEFLRPATLNALVDRLNDNTKPAVDILHFDGHGVFMEVAEDDHKCVRGLSTSTLHNVFLRDRQSRGTESKRVGHGFLVFEDKGRKKHLVSAEDIGDNLFQSGVSLVVLSACQTAVLDEEGDPMASVAGNLTRTGIPAILAMTQSVLVATTRILFGEFYKSLVKGRGIATSLDDARTYLANNPDRYEIRRGDHREMLQLNDWFVPALFHATNDVPLLSDAGRTVPDSIRKHNLHPRNEAGFFGRRRELWDIEYWFTTEETRRVSITGFGGQGKTELAMEAGRWMLRTGMFERVVVIDCASMQSRDAVSIAVSTISTVLEESFVDADAVTHELNATPTLLILDNLESLSRQNVELPVHGENRNTARGEGVDAVDPLHELLTVASLWSQAGNSRVLLTCRLPDTGHRDFAVHGTVRHRCIRLEGLGSRLSPNDALDWSAKLDQLPSAEPRRVGLPDRDELISLFDRVSFHPLSICVLVQQLRTRSAAQLEQRLEQLLSQETAISITEDGTPISLIASLQLSLEWLTERERHAVRRLRVFQGGAFEGTLLTITGFADITSIVDRQNTTTITPDMLDETEWGVLKSKLLKAALIETQHIPGITLPFLRFHPTLCPALMLSEPMPDEADIQSMFVNTYLQFTIKAYQHEAEGGTVRRSLIRSELPNIFRALELAFDSKHPLAALFAVATAQFLGFFGATSDGDNLLKRAVDHANSRDDQTSAISALSSRLYFLLQIGEYDQAIQTGEACLQSIDGTETYESALYLEHLGQCHKERGNSERAEELFRSGIEVCERSSPTKLTTAYLMKVYAKLGDVCRDRNDLTAARAWYGKSDSLAKSAGDTLGQYVVLGQMGSLSLIEQDFATARKLYTQSRKLLDTLDEPTQLPVCHNQLGLTYLNELQSSTNNDTSLLDDAESHFRIAAKLHLQHGHTVRAAESFLNLGRAARLAGRGASAESWFRRVLEMPVNEVTVGVAKQLLASGLLADGERYREAAQLALEAVEHLKNSASFESMSGAFMLLVQITEEIDDPQLNDHFTKAAIRTQNLIENNVDILQLFYPLLSTIVDAIAQGDSDSARDYVERMPHLHDELHEYECELQGVFSRIVNGERGFASLVADIGQIETWVVWTLLEAIEDSRTLDQIR